MKMSLKKTRSAFLSAVSISKGDVNADDDDDDDEGTVWTFVDGVING